MSTSTESPCSSIRSRRAAASPLFANLEGDIGVSFEFFPPKTEKMEAQLWDTFRTLEPLAPSFVSVTYGAGGSTRERTHATVARIAAESAIAPAAHLTCVDASKAETLQIAEQYWEAGVRHIVARFANYWAGSVRGHAEQVEFVVLNDSTARTAALACQTLPRPNRRSVCLTCGPI